MTDFDGLATLSLSLFVQNYSLKDVNKLKPEQAMEIIQKGIRNPKKEFSRPGTSAGAAVGGGEEEEGLE